MEDASSLSPGDHHVHMCHIVYTTTDCLKCHPNDDLTNLLWKVAKCSSFVSSMKE